MMKSILALCLFAFALAGCLGDSKDRVLRKTPSFREGYEDGCGAATAEGSDMRDRPVGNPELYKGDDTYRAGWSNGYQTCRRGAPGTAPASGAIGLPGPGH